MNQQVVPATRLGLVLSIVGFAIAVSLAAFESAVAALGSVYSLPWVLLVIVMVYPPRLIRPGAGWGREPCRHAPAAVLYASAVVFAVGGAVIAASSGPVAAVVAAFVTLTIAALAATVPSVTRAADTSA